MPSGVVVRPSPHNVMGPTVMMSTAGERPPSLPHLQEPIDEVEHVAAPPCTPGAGLREDDMTGQHVPEPRVHGLIGRLVQPIMIVRVPPHERCASWRLWVSTYARTYTHMFAACLTCMSPWDVHCHRRAGAHTSSHTRCTPVTTSQQQLHAPAVGAAQVCWRYTPLVPSEAAGLYSWHAMQLRSVAACMTAH
jgi:hypothetical protein